ncbi:helix-turn-helix domain-containing protein [Kribbella sp. NPDC048928]|uniref:helix-turn-helix domain-containing protein n=1 Tax=Kribbella sp. NPDC048928 TaxID=3364111 RepID=UPI00371FD3AB
MRDVTIADWNKLGATIKAERTRLTLSQHELAARAGVSRSWLAKLEAGHRGAEFEQILRLLDALGVSLILRSDSSAPAEGGVSASAASAHRADPDFGALRELMDKHQHSAEIRRRAWYPDVLEPDRSDNG